MRYEFGSQLRRELPRWIAEGLVSREQADVLAAQYPEARDDGRRRAVVQALAAIGAVGIGLGVILFFAANWDAIARPLRVALLLGALVGGYGGGYALRYGRGRRPAVGEALLLVGGILFGAAIFLVGQMYHVQAHDPLAFLLWTAGVAPTAVVLRSRPLATLAIATLGGWIVYELAVAGDGEAAGYVLVGLSLYGFALYAAGTAAAGRVERAFTLPARQLGFVVGAAAVFVFTFRFVAGELARAERPSGPVLLAGAALALLALAGAGGLALRRGRATAPYEAAAVVASVALVGLAVLLPEAAPNDFGESRAVVYPLLFNLLILVLAVGAIVVGYVNEELWLVNGGIVLVGAEVLARYVDLFWGLLPRSLGFIGAGVILLLLALVLERSRSRLVRREAPA